MWWPCRSSGSFLQEDVWAQSIGVCQGRGRRESQVPPAPGRTVWSQSPDFILGALLFLGQTRPPHPCMWPWREFRWGQCPDSEGSCLLCMYIVRGGHSLLDLTHPFI